MSDQTDRIPVHEVSESVNDNRTLRQALEDSLELVPITQAQAVTRLQELRGDKDWTRRYFAGDKDAIAEYDRLISLSRHGVEPEKFVKPAPMTAAELSDFYQRKYDGPIPAECLAAVEELRAKERGL